MKSNQDQRKRIIVLSVSVIFLIVGFQNCETKRPDLVHTIDDGKVKKQRIHSTSTAKTFLQPQQDEGIDVSNPDAARMIAVGLNHTCVILGNGQVKCWGDNDFGQLGLGDIEPRNDPPLEFVDLGLGRTARAIAAGQKHTCAILDTYNVKCWGGNDFGQLGLGDVEHRGDESDDLSTDDEIEEEMGDHLSTVDLGEGRIARAIVASYNYTCVLLDDGGIKCWGDNYYGQLGLGDINTRGDDPYEMGDQLPYVDLGQNRLAKAITAGKNHTCAILDNDHLKCWGINNLGQLGLGNKRSYGDSPDEMGDHLLAVNLGEGRTVKSVVAGDGYTCATLDNDQVKCWGINHLLSESNLIYHGDDPYEMGEHLLAIPLGEGRSVKKLAAGPYHACVALDNHILKCWGKNNQGQLGLGHTNYWGDQSDETVVALSAIDLGAGFITRSIAIGEEHTCVTLEHVAQGKGQVKCWGSNATGQLGLDLGATDHRGDQANEMGDNLPLIAL